MSKDSRFNISGMLKRSQSIDLINVKKGTFKKGPTVELKANGKKSALDQMALDSLLECKRLSEKGGDRYFEDKVNQIMELARLHTEKLHE